MYVTRPKLVSLNKSDYKVTCGYKRRHAFNMSLMDKQTKTQTEIKVKQNIKLKIKLNSNIYIKQYMKSKVK